MKSFKTKSTPNAKKKQKTKTNKNTTENTTEMKVFTGEKEEIP